MGPAGFEHSDDGIGGTQVDPDDPAHNCRKFRDSTLPRGSISPVAAITPVEN